MSLEVAILEDELAQSQLIESWLLPENYICHTYATGQSLLDALNSNTYNLLLIDWELPDINGPEVMQTVRNKMKIDTPIIFITSRDSEEDIVNALNSGADDYLVKPVRQFEFLARVRANTKRTRNSTSESTQLTHSPYVFKPDNQQVFINTDVVELSSKEFELAFYIFKNQGKLLDRKDILSTVWQQEADLNTRTVDTHMSIIRKKLNIGPENGWRLKSIYGHGYRLEKLD
ncbi:MAG: response regulator transcription factor [Gammaproteobacteria bacterium]|nr:response regulator transcription factor [Gammaproteobacteria bacterium]